MAIGLWKQDGLVAIQSLGERGEREGLAVARRPLARILSSQSRRLVTAAGWLEIDSVMMASAG
jgi:hypothetical protein